MLRCRLSESSSGSREVHFFIKSMSCNDFDVLAAVASGSRNIVLFSVTALASLKGLHANVHFPNGKVDNSLIHEAKTSVILDTS